MDTAKEKRAIAYLKNFEPQNEPYYLCYSGGKDSDCIRILASLADVKHDIVHNLTTVDAPDTVNYIKSIPGCTISRPEVTMWDLIVQKKSPPTRLIRFCCEKLKEKGGKGRVKITGVRKSESISRQNNGGVVKILGKPKTIKKAAEQKGIEYEITPKGGLILNHDNDNSRRFVEFCYRTTSTMINPIIDWTDDDVWEFLRHYGCKSNPLYECGFKRIGCIGCPLSGPKNMIREFSLYPKYKYAYIRTFDRMLRARTDAGLKTNETWKNGEAVFNWWIGNNYRGNVK